MKNKILIAGMWILAIIIIIISFMLATKWYMINEIMKNVEKNLDVTSYMVGCSNFFEIDTYITDGNQQYQQVYSKLTNEPRYEAFSIKDEHLSYIYNLQEKKYEKKLGGVSDHENQLTYDLYEKMILKDKIKALFTWKVRSEKIDGRKCYYIRKNIDDVGYGEEYEFWIDKENYYKVKTTVKENFAAGNPSYTRYYSVYSDETIKNYLEELRMLITKNIETE